VTFGVGVITPRWLYVLAAATGTACADPVVGIATDSARVQASARRAELTGRFVRRFFMTTPNPTLDLRAS
jgi:hypothetical protein